MTSNPSLKLFARVLDPKGETLNYRWQQLKQAVFEDCIPSEVIRRALRKYGQGLPKWKGSELGDTYFACFSAYVDLTYVDKRTHKNFWRARQKCAAFASVAGRVKKAAHYWDIAKHMATNAR